MAAQQRDNSVRDILDRVPPEQSAAQWVRCLPEEQRATVARILLKVAQWDDDPTQERQQATEAEQRPNHQEHTTNEAA